MTNWNIRHKRYNYFRTAEQEDGDRIIHFTVRDLADALKKELRMRTSELRKETFIAEIKGLVDGMNDENQEAPYASPVSQGGLRYEVSHPNAPILSEDAEYDQVRESTAADGNQRALRKMAAIYDGSNPKDKNAYSLFHHLGSGSQALVPQQVRKIAKKLGLSDKPGQGIIPTKSNPADADSVARGHIIKHLNEMNK